MYKQLHLLSLIGHTYGGQCFCESKIPRTDAQGIYIVYEAVRGIFLISILYNTANPKRKECDNDDALRHLVN